MLHIPHFLFPFCFDVWITTTFLANETLQITCAGPRIIKFFLYSTVKMSHFRELADCTNQVLK